MCVATRTVAVGNAKSFKGKHRCDVSEKKNFHAMQTIMTIGQ
jgi:hypothetical protein